MSDNTVSISVDDEIFRCLNEPKSFFLLAGAGSGKTRSLINVLKRFREENVFKLRQNSQRVAIITYTNAACDLIKRRLDYDNTFSVSTIHSFAWNLIKNYTIDIKKWLARYYRMELEGLEEKQSTARNTTTKSYMDRARKIDILVHKLRSLDVVKKFTYNPNGENVGRSSLNHSQVIQIAAYFLHNKPLMQNILVRKYPILLIDECQDTNKEFIDALIEVQKNKTDCFCLGLFGDTMQRIYMDGKVGLEKIIPDTWSKPEKKVNYRCPKRVVTLLNRIRSNFDDHTQEPAQDKDEGIIRVFIVDLNKESDRLKVESEVSVRMAQLTNDNNWTDPQSDVKVLTLEHHMAASRGGFSNFFGPLYREPKMKDGLLNGSLPGISLFADQIVPLIRAKKAGNNFEVARILRRYSPLLSKEVLQSSSNPIDEIINCNTAVLSLISLWDDESEPSLNQILKEVYRTGLFEFPDELIPIAQQLLDSSDVLNEPTIVETVMNAWEEALKCTFTEFELYLRYINEQSRFGTHQGVKGLEFPRVMVILDDEEARGHYFSYEKLFGVVPPSESDINNEKVGKDTSIHRTRRLFYVTCSRASKDLAIVAYTENPEIVMSNVLGQNWFNIDEIEVFNGERFDVIEATSEVAVTRESTKRE